MKKRLLLLFGFVFLLTGCFKISDQLQEKKEYGEGYGILTCDLVQEEVSGDAQRTYLRFVKNKENNKFEETSLNLEFDYTSTLKDDKTGIAKKTMHSSLNIMCETFEKQGYFDCYYTADDYVYTLTMGMDVDTFAEGAAGVITENSSLEDIKTGLESQKELTVSNCVIEK